MMKKVFRLKVLSICTAIIVLIMSGVFTGCSGNNAALSPDGRTYYVDSAAGKDENKGTGESKPWKSLEKVNSMVFMPGDRILFKAGGKWTGTLSPKGSGAENKPIVLDMYGEGEKPLIQGTGERESAGLYLKNQQYVEINNLHVTNPGPIDAGERRRGIYVTAEAVDWPETSQEKPAVLNHIYIKNCEVSNVDGVMLGMDSHSKCYGGIIFKVISPRDSKNWVKFNDILIEKNYIHDLSRNGLYTHTDFTTNMPYSDGQGSRPRLPFTNFAVRSNYVQDVGGDGLVVTTCDSPVMEYNVVARPQRVLGNDLYAVGMWPFASENAVLQYNESYGNQSTKDGQGFDLDFGCKGSILQYNYSHDNEGGFLLICSGPGMNENPVARYNISQNDGGILNSRIFEISGDGTSNAQIYNNTIYTANSEGLRITKSLGVWEGTPQSITFRNNIFFSNAENVTFESGPETQFDHNLFYNVVPPEGATNSITADPMLEDPGSGTTGGRVDLGEKTGNVDGYKLKDGSPCIDAGTVIENNGGKDYWGNQLYNGVPDIGANEK